MQTPPATSYTAEGFFRSLFDTSFSSLIVTCVIKVAYVIAIVVFSLVALGALIGALASKKPGEIVVAIILIPIVWLVYLIWTRILLELVIIIFRIGEDVRRISLSSALIGESQGVSTTSIEPLSGSGATPTGTGTSITSHTEPLRQDTLSQRATESGTAQSPSASQEDSPKEERPAAGWYQDPEYEGYTRFWSGESWSDQRRQMNP